MIRAFVFFTVLALFSSAIEAQTLTGRITDTKHRPVPNAAFYIRETTQGLVADNEGEFRLELKEGVYTGEVSSLGYTKQTVTFTVTADGAKLAIELEEMAYRLREVVVTKGKEDPAYYSMRNVIARAPYFLRQIKAYEADIYIKGSIKVDKIPALLKSRIKDKKALDMIDKLYLHESQNEVKYREPDKYEQHVTAISSTIPESFNINDNFLIDLIKGNIYYPTSFGGLLGAGSFSVYKFSLEDSYIEDGRLVNKIRVTPKKNSPQLVSGWLYVAEDIWMIQKVDLTAAPIGATYRFNLSYNEVRPDVFMPTAYDMLINISVMGIKGSGRFYASMKYNSIETNSNYVINRNDSTPAATSTASPTRPPTKKQQKDLKKLEELVGKDRLTTREAYRMAKLVESTVETEEEKQKKRRLERRPADSLIVATRDTLAMKRDSTFWVKARTLPLKDDEIRSYIQRDSLRLVVDSVQSADSIHNRTAGTWLMHFLLGETVKIDSNRFFLQYGGLVTAYREYNFVDGFRLGQTFRFGGNFKDSRSIRSFTVSPAVYYTTARKELIRTVDGSLVYAPMRGGKFDFSTGNTSTDFAGNAGGNRLGNSVASIYSARNIVKYYRKKFVYLSNRIDLANGLVLNTSFEYEKRNDLDNNTTFNFAGNTPASNRPHGQTDLMPTHESYTANIALWYTHRLHYRIRKGEKIYLNSDFPSVQFLYSKAFPGKSNLNSSYDKIEAWVYQEIKLNLFDRLLYAVDGGMFLSKSKTYLPDFKHFRTSEIFFTGNALSNSFSLLDNYSPATNDKWLQAHVSFNSDYLLIKQIPPLQRYVFDESLHVKTLWTPNMIHSEAGYSIVLGDVGQIGVFVGFNRLKYDGVGITVSLPIIGN
ncbi:MAG: DUF5686 and carboxypeptidase regulatory-like domain-containing protein [Tannerella sp.]|jgi:hypothetical protein|nr:DUF5686 and carboxypeptidase regulatory-like domain-containing protein [Tannerella sp.]